MDFFINKTNGEWRNTAAMKEYWDALPDGKYIVTAPKSTKQRSHDQNAYYWSVVVPMVYEGLRTAGFEAVRNKEDAHEIMKNLFLKIKEERNDLKIERVGSTTELTTIGFAEYLMHIFTWSFDYLNITIPEPNQQLEFSLDPIN